MDDKGYNGTTRNKLRQYERIGSSECIIHGRVKVAQNPWSQGNYLNGEHMFSDHETNDEFVKIVLRLPQRKLATFLIKCNEKLKEKINLSKEELIEIEKKISLP